MLSLPKLSVFYLMLYILSDTDEWCSWKNTNGQTVAIRTHLETKHKTVWRSLVMSKRLKGWDQLGGSTSRRPGVESSDSSFNHEEFTYEGFLRYLCDWILSDDQARI
jgi:hypothetical protein